MAQPTGLVPITKTETLSVIEKGMQLASKTVESTHKEIVPVEQSETIKGGDHIMIGDESVANGAQPLHPRGSENDRNQEQVEATLLNVHSSSLTYL